jgi:hypothetical protein
VAASNQSGDVCDVILNITSQDMILHSGLKKNNASVAEKALPAQVFGNEIVNVRTGSGTLHQPASPEQSRGGSGALVGAAAFVDNVINVQAFSRALRGGSSG